MVVTSRIERPRRSTRVTTQIGRLMTTYALTADVPEEQAEDVSALLLDGGATGAEVRDRSVAPMPGVASAPPGWARVIAFFATRAEAEAAAAAQGLAAVIDEVAEQDWGEAWKRGLGPIRVGRLVVRPSWTARVPDADVEVVLDPGMAFGTGTHPTTALCLAALDALLAAARGAHVLDVGTGSGILAIAAAKLGAGRVVATDDDPVALDVAGENARRNGVALELTRTAPDEVAGQFPIVVANILANTLVALAPALAPRVARGGTLLLSGIVAGQEDEVSGAYRRVGLAPRPALDRADGEWRLVALTREGSP